MTSFCPPVHFRLPGCRLSRLSRCRSRWSLRAGCLWTTWRKTKCRKIFLKFRKPSKGVVDGEAIVGAIAELGVPWDRHRHHKLGLSVHQVDSFNITMLSDEMTHFATILLDSLVGDWWWYMIIQDLVTWTSCKQWWCVWRTRWRCFRQDRLHFRSCWCWCQKGLQESYYPLSQNILAPPVASFAQLSWTNVDEDDIIVRSNVLDHSVDRVHHLNPDEVDPVQPRDGLVQLGLVHLPSWCEMMMMMMFSWVWAWCQRVTIMFWKKLGSPNKSQSQSGRPASPATQWSTRRKGGG